MRLLSFFFTKSGADKVKLEAGQKKSLNKLH
jgi:hypothetical protein